MAHMKSFNHLSLLVPIVTPQLPHLQQKKGQAFSMQWPQRLATYYWVKISSTSIENSESSLIIHWLFTDYVYVYIYICIPCLNGSFLSLVGDFNPLKNDRLRHLGCYSIPNSQLFLESQSKFHGSSHHQPAITVYPLWNSIKSYLVAHPT